VIHACLSEVQQGRVLLKAITNPIGGYEVICIRHLSLLRILSLLPGAGAETVKVGIIDTYSGPMASPGEPRSDEGRQ
jgi:hypothetical protein